MAWTDTSLFLPPSPIGGNQMPHFNKRHYEAIATAMQDAHYRVGATGESDLETVVSAIADTLCLDNSLFKRDHFIAACQPGVDVRARKVA